MATQSLYHVALDPDWIDPAFPTLATDHDTQVPYSAVGIAVAAAHASNGIYCRILVPMVHWTMGALLHDASRYESTASQ